MRELNKGVVTIGERLNLLVCTECVQYNVETKLETDESLLYLLYMYVLHVW